MVQISRMVGFFFSRYHAHINYIDGYQHILKMIFFSAPRDEYINNEVMRIKMVLFAIEINLHKIRAYDTSAKITETNLT